MAKLLLKRGACASDEVLVNMVKKGRDGDEETLKIVRMMIEGGASVIRDSNAIWYAAYMGKENLVALLLENGASVHLFLFLFFFTFCVSSFLFVYYI